MRGPNWPFKPSLCSVYAAFCENLALLGSAQSRTLFQSSEGPEVLFHFLVRGENVLRHWVMHNKLEESRNTSHMPLYLFSEGLEYLPASVKAFLLSWQSQDKGLKCPGTKARKFVEKLSWWIVFLGSDRVMGHLGHMHTPAQEATWSAGWVLDPLPKARQETHWPLLPPAITGHLLSGDRVTSQVQQCGWFKSAERQRLPGMWSANSNVYAVWVKILCRFVGLVIFYF